MLRVASMQELSTSHQLYLKDKGAKERKLMSKDKAVRFPGEEEAVQRLAWAHGHMDGGTWLGIGWAAGLVRCQWLTKPGD